MTDPLKAIQLTHGCMVRDHDGRTWVWDDMNMRRIYIDEYGIGPAVPVGLSPSGILMTFTNTDLTVPYCLEENETLDG